MGLAYATRLGNIDSALEVVVVLSIVAPVTLLAVVCWISGARRAAPTNLLYSSGIIAGSTAQNC